MADERSAALAIFFGVAVAAFVRQSRAKRIKGLPSSLSDIVRRHVPDDDFEGFADAVRAHLDAGRPLTRAALGMLAAIHLDPGAVDAIKADLEAAGY